MLVTLYTALIYASIIWVVTSIGSRVFDALAAEYRIIDIIWNQYWCPKCVTFWITLTSTYNFPAACIAALIAHCIDIFLSKVKL